MSDRLDSVLAGLDRDRLHTLLARLVQRHPDLLHSIESELRSWQDDDPDSRAARAAVDLNAVRRQMTRALHHPPTDTGRGWYFFHLGPEASELLDRVWELIRTGDGRNAMDLLNVMTDECMENWQSIMEDEEGETLRFVEEELGPAWTEAILSTDLTPVERQGWEAKLDAWASDLADYTDSGSFDVSLKALEEGWDTPELHHILQGEVEQRDVATGERYHDLDIRNRLIDARLNVLERRQRYDEFLNLARAEGKVVRYTTMLARRGQAAAAAQYGVAQLQQAGDALTLAQELRDVGRVDEAARVGERGLALEGTKAALGTWLARLAAEMGRQELALSAATVAFLEEKSLASCLRVQELAGTAWPARRDDFLARLRQARDFQLQGPVDIFLHEGLVDDAITLVDRSTYPFPDLIRRVARAAVERQPNWVIQACSKQAESIMDAAKSSAYGQAADWLAMAKHAYAVAGREAEWQDYLAGLLEQHRRKYRLMPLLRNLSDSSR